jgi:PmbA protein
MITINNCKELLEEKRKNDEISDWTIIFKIGKKKNFYFEKDFKPESILSSKREEISITVFKEFGDDLGEADFVLSVSDDVETLEKELETAIFVSQFAKSKKYTLPEKDSDLVNDSHIDYNIFANKKFTEDLDNTSIEEFIDDKIIVFENLLKKYSNKDVHLYVNSFEILTNVSDSQLLTSKGIDKSLLKDSYYMEFVLTAKDENTQKETEHIVYEKINDLYEYNYEEFFTNSIKLVIDTTKAEKAKDFKGEIMLSESAAADFFIPDLTSNSLLAYGSGRLKFLGISNYEIDKDLEFKADKITVYFNPLIEGNSSSSPYDGFGISANRLCIIEKGIFKNFFASKQYADYLNIKATGPTGVVEVECGDSNKSNLLLGDNKKIEIVSFSSFVPDLTSGNYSAEIRLGYIHENGKKIPFKGGLFSGNVFEVMKEMKFSKEKMNVPGYVGPKYIKFLKGDVTGV